MTVRTTTDIHPATVAAVAAGDVPRISLARGRRGTWNRPVARELVDRRALVKAIDLAGGDPNRLWFDRTDGSVWVLNHTRATRCTSPACPPCSAA